jgi:phosphoglycerate dehydrogenase-like enzyme
VANPKIDIYMPVDETGGSHERMIAAGIDLKLADEPWAVQANRRETIELTFDPDTVIGVGVANRLRLVTRKSLESAPGLRMIAKYSVGFDNVDVDAATEMGILVVHSPTETNWGGVAEGTMANMLAILKRVRERDRHVKNGGWRDPALLGTYLGARQIDDYEGITVGIIGLGRIGSRLADLLAPWRLKIIAHDPYVAESVFAHHNVKQVELDTLLREADVVTLHCNLTGETRNMIAADQLALMKPSAVLLNAARGPMVDIDALFDALDGDRIAGAALDVLPEEPPEPQTPLLGLGEKILLSPHMISQNQGTGLQIAVPWVEQAVFDVLHGRVPKHIANPDALPAWRARFEGNGLL